MLLKSTFLIFLGTKLVDGQTTAGGWSINCNIKTSNPDDNESDQPGPFSLAISGTPKNYNILFSGRSRSYGGILAVEGTFGGNSNNLCQNAASSNETLAFDLLYSNIFDWPNQISYVPQGVFSDDNSGNKYVLITDGAPTFSSQDGCMAAVDISNFNFNDFSKNVNNFPVGTNNIKYLTMGCGYNINIRSTLFYYTEAKWFDMDNDGDLDLIVPRGSGVSGYEDAAESELDWWVNPGPEPFTASTANIWEHEYIPASRNIGDTFMDIMAFPENSDNPTIYVVMAGISSHELVVLYADDWTRTSNINSQLVATSNGGGAFASVQFTDLNGDNIPDILATMSSVNGNSPAVVAYPGYVNSGTQQWFASTSKNMLYNGFPTFESYGMSSPGQARSFYYKTSDENNSQKLPSILISGHDDGYLYVLDPIYDNDPTQFSFNYDSTIAFRTEAFNPFWTANNAPSVGIPEVLDLDNDGCNEVILPSAGTNALYFLDVPSDKC